MPDLETTLLNILHRHRSDVPPIPTTHPSRLVPLPGIRAVLFDVYGTLLASGAGELGIARKPDAALAFAQALHSIGIQVPPARAASLLTSWRACIHDDHARSRARGIDTPEVDIREIWAEFLTLHPQLPPANDLPRDHLLSIAALEYECRVNPVAPMPGLIPMLTSLHETGLPLGIVSNAQFYTPLLFTAYAGSPIEQLGINPDYCAWSYRHRVAKPSPRLFQIVLDALLRDHRIHPAQVLYLGNDMLNDVWTAHTAGCQTVLFAGDQRSLRLRENDPRCRDLQPHAVITRLDQLPPLLSGVFP
ncbi:MAG TPA: HAD family hydrolase [Kiritimatiellia bacterium]|nr:HAD family hydrolase [Kiritimatiellia bacterium]